MPNLKKKPPSNKKPRFGNYPTKFSEEKARKVIQYLKTGCHVETAAAAVGVSRETLYYWMRRGAEGREPYKDFSEAVDIAYARAEMGLLAIIDKAAVKNWTAAAWKLERRYPERWRDRSRDPPDNDKRALDVAQIMQVIVNAYGVDPRALTGLKRLLPADPEPKPEDGE